MKFGEQQLIVLQTVLAVAAPEEGCALLLGPAHGEHWAVTMIWPCLNVWQPVAERSRRFALDPREQLLAQKWARQRGWQVHGSAHSHPVGALVPSDTDRALAFAPTVMVIAAAGPATGGAEAPVRAWWLAQDPEEAPRSLPLLPMDPATGDHGE
ncbi:MAG: M67 family metallopeptidase [Cyanobacteriota bacterium]